MNDLVHSGPTTVMQALRALARYPERTAFASGDSRLSYRAALDLIGRMQAVIGAGKLRRGERVAILTANGGSRGAPALRRKPRG